MDLKADSSFDLEGIRAAVNEKTKMVHIQRSKGYQTRKTLSVTEIGEVIAFVKSIKPDVICMVDNCYGEFVERIEPTDCLLYTSWKGSTTTVSLSRKKAMTSYF